MIANIVLDYFFKGGPIMWPILVALLAALTVVAERVLWWWSLKKRIQHQTLLASFDAISSGHFDQALHLTSNTNDPFLRTVHTGLLNAHTSLLGAMQLNASDELEPAERFQWVLGTLITLAPLLGLLGTVTGIIHSFSFVGNEQLEASKVSGGIAEALIATACGLGIAIFCLIPYNFFNRRFGWFRSELERTINHVELIAESAKHHDHNLEDFSRGRALQMGSTRPLATTAAPVHA